ncbi:MAG TPA: RnfABCDGE type electron transport complex subunit D [Bacilli bacterium]
MAVQKRFNVGKNPYIRKADNTTYGTNVIMRDFLISLLPLVLFAWVKNGILPFAKGDCGFFQMLYPLLFVLIGGLSTYLIEGLYYLIFFKEENICERLSKSYAIIPGVLLAMVLPLNTPIWLLVLGSIFTSVIGKLLFGGFGYNIFNPALIGYVFISVAFFGVIRSAGGTLNPTESLEIVSNATPLSNFFSNPSMEIDKAIEPYGNLLNFFVGLIPGSIAETSSLLCIVSFVYLLVRRVINWRIPVIYIGTVFIFTYLIGALNGYATDLRYPLFQILSGGLFFGAVFMATEPVTSPRTPNGEIIFAIFLGVITVMLRYLTDNPEGVASSILFMNLFTPTIDNVFAKVRVANKPINKVMGYVYAGIIVLAIVGFTLIQLEV